MVEEGNFEFQYWTYSVHYYNEDSDEVDILGLGPLISRRCDDLAGETRKLHQKLGEVISDIEVETSEVESQNMDKNGPVEGEEKEIEMA